MKKSTSMVAVFVAALLLTLGVAAPASADTPVDVYAGLKITPTIEYEGHCTLGAVGYDSAGRHIGITAGHCIPTPTTPLPIPAYDFATKTRIGTYVAIDSRTDHDWAVIVLNDAANMKSTAPDGYRVDHIGGSGQACRKGATSGVACGQVSVITPPIIGAWISLAGGDSGGPLAVKGGLIGIADRIDYTAMFRVASQYVWININQILADFNKLGGPGAGFTPVNN